MNVNFLNPFIEAAYEVLKTETSLEAKRGDLRLEQKPYVTEDITVIISLVGEVEGNVFYGLPMTTALNLVGRVYGEPIREMNNLALSGVAELGNVITGQASMKLSRSGFQSNISPPTMIEGKGAVISTPDYVRLVVPLVTEAGTLIINLALRESKQRNLTTAQIPVPARPNVAAPSA